MGCLPASGFQNRARHAPHILMSHPLEPALNGERLTFQSAGFVTHCYVAGEGPPLLLIHSVNAAASAAEVRPLFDHFRRTRTVFALDLPGFGFSDRSDRAYTPRVMTDALHAAVDLIRERLGVVPVDALAVSLSSEFLARAASEAPQHFRRIALVSPTGFALRDKRRGAPGGTLAMPWLLRVLRGPGWGGALFRGLTRPGVIRFFLNKTWGSKSIDEPMWRYAVATAQQAGAEHAPLQFIAGGLFSCDIQNIYEQIALPIWMSHGVRGDFTDYAQKSLVASRPNWRITVFPTGALPYFEVPQSFCDELQLFLAGD
jgi:pimeloyl-ACP methyl ester carboxylesterase